MKTWTCVVVGAGFAGIHAVKEIRKTFEKQSNKYRLRLILMDKNPYHFRKVLLFRPAVTEADIRIPLTKIFPEGVEIIQGTVSKIETDEKMLQYQDAEGIGKEINYDKLVVAIGSEVRKPDLDKGGIALATLDSALKIRDTWLSNMNQAVRETNKKERERLMTIAIAGAGISGVETAAELSYYARKDAERLGLDPNEVKINLYNAHKRLFLNAPPKVGIKLEDILSNSRVNVFHETRVEQEKDGVLTLSNGKKISTGLLIWTLGLKPNSILEKIGMPVDSEGYVVIDESYRVQGPSDVYSIGDCAKVVEPQSGKVDGMTCKEAIPQAKRLSKILLADIEGLSAPVHQSYPGTFTIGLGPDKGLFWLHKWGIDFVITGKVAWRIKKYTWNFASLIH